MDKTLIGNLYLPLPRRLHRLEMVVENYLRGFSDTFQEILLLWVLNRRTIYRVGPELSQTPLSLMIGLNNLASLNAYTLICHS